MVKIKCPKCSKIVFETDGSLIFIRNQRKYDGLTLPFTPGPFIHNACGNSFILPLQENLSYAIIQVTKVAKAT